MENKNISMIYNYEMRDYFERDMKILNMRINTDLSYKKIGEKFNLTRARIAQICFRANRYINLKKAENSGLSIKYNIDPIS